MIIIRKISRAANQHVMIISEGLCDTENWSNDAENSNLITEINYILTYSQWTFHNFTDAIFDGTKNLNYSNF